MLEFRPIMNSSIEEILAFKTCCSLFRVFDQNLEIHVTNKGDSPVTLHSSFELVGEHGVTLVQTVTPPGEHRIDPGEIKAFYCSMDETLWGTSDKMIFSDNKGNHYPVPISH